MAKENLRQNDAEKSYSFTFENGSLESALALALKPRMDEYETDKFNSLRGKFTWLVELMDRINEKLKKIDDFWIYLLDSVRFEKLNREFGTGKISYSELNKELISLDQLLDKVIDEYNKRNDS